MRKSNESGVTLIEMLAVIVVGSLIVVLLYSIITKSTDTYDKQVNKNKEVNDAAYALKVITKELRRTVNVSINEQSCALTAGSNVFHFENGTLFQNDNPLASNLQSFKATTGEFNVDEHCMNGDSNQISIKLITNTNQIFATEIALRKGG